MIKTLLSGWIRTGWLIGWNKNSMKRYIFLILFLTSCVDNKETIVCECVETNDIIVINEVIKDIDICDTVCE